MWSKAKLSNSRSVISWFWSPPLMGDLGDVVRAYGFGSCCCFCVCFSDLTDSNKRFLEPIYMLFFVDSSRLLIKSFGDLCIS